MKAGDLETGRQFFCNELSLNDRRVQQNIS